MSEAQRGAARCLCHTSHQARLIVVTGGPGAGKTALLELARRDLCHHVVLLPEAASIIYGGGFPRGDSLSLRRAAQRAIFHVQRELERAALEEDTCSLILCDRGTLDSVAYYPGDAEELWRDVKSSSATELARYHAVLHLRTPPASEYNHSNPLRIESAAEAERIDERILAAWSAHPRRLVVGHDSDFLTKAAVALQWIRAEVPPCCR